MTSDEIGSVIGKGLLILILLPLALLAHAATLSYLWEWYVVYHFHLASLPLVIAWGLGLTAKMFTVNIADSNVLSTVEDKKRIEYVHTIFIGLFFNLSMLLVGWIGTFFR